MRAASIVFVSLVLPQIFNGQSDRIHLSIEPSVNTANPAVASVLDVWEKYLNAHPDSVYANPYWMESEQHQYQPFDLAGHTWWNPSLYRNVQHCKSSVLSVTPSDS